MTRRLLILLVAISLAGCAHKELKAPCTNVAAFNAGDVPCEKRQPVNDVGPLVVFER